MRGVEGKIQKMGDRLIPMPELNGTHAISFAGKGTESRKHSNDFH